MDIENNKPVNNIIRSTVVFYEEPPKEATWGFDDSFYALQVLHNAGYPTVGIFDPHEGYTFEEWQQEADIVVRGFNELSLATLEAYPVKNEQKN